MHTGHICIQAAFSNIKTGTEWVYPVTQEFTAYSAGLDIPEFTTVKFKASNTIQISDSGSAGESSLGLDNLSGNLAFNNAIVINKTENTLDGKGQVGFNTTLTLNPSQTAEGVFRARDLNFYAPGATSGSRLGEIALTGGRLTSQLNIIPRNWSWWKCYWSVFNLSSAYLYLECD